MEISINYLAVLGAAAAAVVLGALWFGPLFGKIWMKEMGFTKEDMEKGKTDPAAQKAMMKSYLLVAVGALITAYVMAHSLTFAMSYLNSTGPQAALMGAFWNWLGFTAPALMGSVLWEGKSWKYWAVVAGYYLVSFAIMAVILTAVM
jgi:hypothetical protein